MAVLPSSPPANDGTLASLRLSLGFAQRAERLGYDSVWVLDRLVYPNLAPISSLAALAAVPERLQLGASVLLPLLHSPLMLAKELATIDVLRLDTLVLIPVVRDLVQVDRLLEAIDLARSGVKPAKGCGSPIRPSPAAAVLAAPSRR